MNARGGRDRRFRMGFEKLEFVALIAEKCVHKFLNSLRFTHMVCIKLSKWLWNHIETKVLPVMQLNNNLGYTCRAVRVP